MATLKFDAKYAFGERLRFVVEGYGLTLAIEREHLAGGAITGGILSRALASGQDGDMIISNGNALGERFDPWVWRAPSCTCKLVNMTVTDARVVWYI